MMAVPERDDDASHLVPDVVEVGDHLQQTEPDVRKRSGGNAGKVIARRGQAITGDVFETRSGGNDSVGRCT